MRGAGIDPGFSRGGGGGANMGRGGCVSSRAKQGSFC